MVFNVVNLEEIRHGIESRVGDIKKSYLNFDKVFEDSCLLLQEMLGVDKNDKIGIAYSKFLLRVGILSYFGKLENDVNMENLIASAKSKLEEKAKKNIDIVENDTSDPEVVPVTISLDKSDSSNESDETTTKTVYVKQDLDFKFGFNGYSDILTAFLESILNSSESENIVKVNLETNLLGSIREVSVDEYKDNSFYLNSDIMLITLLGRKPQVDMHEEVMKLIKKNHTYHGYNTQLQNAILSTYKYALQDSFGLRPYVGVVIKDSPFIYTISDSFKLVTISNARNSFASVSESVLEKLNIVVKSNRQFDIKEIICGNHSLTQYYPKKILEYSLGRELTSNLASGVYKPHAKNRSWEEYEEAYVKKQIIEYIDEAIYYSLEKNIDFSKSSIDKLKKHVKGKNFSFMNDEVFKEIYSQNVDMINKELLTSPEINRKLQSDLIYFQKCLCTIVCAIKYNSVGDQVNALGIRVVDTSNTLDKGLSKTIFQPLNTNLNTVYHDGLIVSEGKTVDGVNPLPYTIYEFSHDFNEALSNAEPLFGYTAVNMFINRGVPIKWDKILLGEDFKGTPFFASLEDGDDVQVQGNLVHNMIAGSRAGKGVQTMNLLGSALASNKPIFYLDNKPDMAIMFNQLSGGNMFIVQGGFFGDNADKSFMDNGSAIAGWDTHYDALPQYVKDNFFTNRTYEGSFGQMVYYRALMLIFGIILARVATASNNPAVYSKLGGSNGIVAVVDELKAWQAFEQQYFSCQGIFAKKFKDIDEISSTLSNLNDDLSLEQEKLSNLEPGKTQYINTEGKIKNIKKKINGIIRPEEAYATQIMYKLGETLIELRSSAVAGMKNTERFCSDIFVIAQNLKLPYSIDSVTSTVYTRKASGGFNTTNEMKLSNHSLVRGFFDCIDHDYFIGANLDDDLAGSKTNEKFKALIQNKSYWLYIPSNIDNSSENIASGQCSKETIFKPYLVLNNSKEDDPNNRKMIAGVDENGKACQVPDPDYNYVGQCRNRVNKAVAGLWEEVRLKHLNEICREEAREGIDKHYGELNAGIGFEGLVNLIKQSNNLGAFEPSTDLSGSLEIANYVARAMGYLDYKDLLFDLSPEGIFSAVDVKNALIAPNIYADKSKRLPVLSKFGFLGDTESQQGISDEDPELCNDDSENLENYVDPQSTNQVGTEVINNNNHIDYNDDYDWFAEELGIDDNEQNQGEYQEQQSNPISTTSQVSQQSNVWTDEDRYAVAENMVEAYLLGKEGSPDYYKLSNENMRSSLIRLMIEIIISLGY